jgi:hypothetical protein
VSVVSELWPMAHHQRPPIANAPQSPAFGAGAPRFRRADVFQGDAFLPQSRARPATTPGPGYGRMSHSVNEIFFVFVFPGC